MRWIFTGDIRGGVSCFLFKYTLRKEKRDPPDGGGPRGSALGLVWIQRWEAVFRRERMPVSIDRLPYRDPERKPGRFLRKCVDYFSWVGIFQTEYSAWYRNAHVIIRFWKRCGHTVVSLIIVMVQYLQVCDWLRLTAYWTVTKNFQRRNVRPISGSMVTQQRSWNRQIQKK